MAEQQASVQLAAARLANDGVHLRLRVRLRLRMHMQRGTVNRDRREVTIVIGLLLLAGLLGGTW
ncbi:MAG TPA: hypothetical protein VGP04_18925 [Pseudonocardiaceae bacterium]|nr:hypothetical protein [Pseudonocardiaceae bacterium]